MARFPTVPLSSVATIKSGYAFKSAEWRSTGIPVVKIANVLPGNVTLEGCSFVGPEAATNAQEFTTQYGDPLIAMSGATVGKIGRVRFHERALINQRVGRFRVIDSNVLNPDFLYYFLQLDSTFESYVSSAYGSAQPNISPSLILATEIPIPSIQEQRSIAQVLGTLDEKIAANTKLAETADALATSLVRSRFTGKNQPLNEIASVIMGSSPTGDTLNESGLGTVFYQGVRDFGFRFPANRIWTTSPTRMAEPGDTLVSVRAPVGRVNLANERTCIGRGLASVRSRRDTPSTLFHLLQASTEIWEPYEAEGTVFGSINRKQLETIQVPMLEADTALESRVASIEETIQTSIEENRTLAATRDTLLPQLMSGKLRVKDIENTMGEMV